MTRPLITFSRLSAIEVETDEDDVAVLDAAMRDDPDFRGVTRREGKTYLSYATAPDEAKVKRVRETVRARKKP